MSDFRLFCFALFTGLGLGAALQNRGIWTVPADLDGGGGIMVAAFALASAVVMLFGRDK